jgi:imidazolonepropionase-like amidohydrolase
MHTRVVWLILVAWTAAWGQGLWAVRDARVFDGSAFCDGWTVVVDGGRITAAGPRVRAAEGALIVDGRGRTLLPGMAAGGGTDEAELRTSGISAMAPGGHGTEYGVPIPTLPGLEDAAFAAARVKDGAD